MSGEKRPPVDWTLVSRDVYSKRHPRGTRPRCVLCMLPLVAGQLVQILEDREAHPRCVDKENR